MFVRWSLLLFGLACLALTALLIDRGEGIESATLSALVGVTRNLAAAGMTVGLIFGGVLLWINRRRRRALKRNPWVVWRMNYVTTGRYEWVELLDPNGQPVSALILSTWPKDIGKVFNHNTSEVWFAGDPTKYGVISRPGGGDLRYAYLSKTRPVPRWTFRTNNPEGEVGRDTPSPTSLARELTRERGRVMMKPVGESAGVRHGGSQDTRYPSPRLLRRALAFAIDWALHLGIGLGSAIAVSPEFSVEAATRFDWKHLGVSPIVALGFWMLSSAADRVGMQAIFHTTVGKAVFGLRVIRPDDGTFPSLGRLFAVWLVDLYLLLAFPIALVGNSDLPGPDRVEDYFLPAVRRRDIRAPR
ncbi:RDD family protein [Nocardia sp. NPDC049707]|uniref:RDD family protein n=1 Tax=Nocardia sp. NPDC049707 TaxID=3154735 RepID=UPI003449F322